MGLVGNYLDLCSKNIKNSPNFKKKTKRPAVFFDRDNTLVHDNGYTYKKNDLSWIEGAKDVIKFCNKKGILVFIISNQSGIARGFYKIKDVNIFHLEMKKQLNTTGSHIDDIEICPHHPDGKVKLYRKKCNCRKPNTGMIESILKKWAVDINKSILIGDKSSDLLCGQKMGINSYQFNEKNLFNFFKNIYIEKN